MLYVTTRDNQNPVDSRVPLLENRCGEGGFYVPFPLPKLSQNTLRTIFGQSFGQTAAQILNLLLDTKLTSWDVDFAIGRHPVRVKPIGHRTVMAETWNNPQWEYARHVKNLTALVCASGRESTDWMRIAVRIAFLFGIWPEAVGNPGEKFDIVAVTGDFSAPISAWYAREMGLPVENIVCCCNENDQFWDLTCNGQMRTDAISVPSDFPALDVAVPEDLERLIYACGGVRAVSQYLDACQRGTVYFPEEGLLRNLRKGIHASVVSHQRIRNTISNVYQTSQDILSSHSALAYCGLLDYRYRTGNTRPAVILAELSPVKDLETVASAMDISPQKLKQIL